MLPEENIAEHAKSTYNAGLTALLLGKVKEADFFFRKAANLGKPEAMNNLAMLHGGGYISPCDIDFACDCVFDAAQHGHEKCKAMAFFISKADDCSLGALGVDELAKQPFNAMPLPFLMMTACRFYKAVTEVHGVVDEFVLHQIKGASCSEYDCVLDFVKRTGISTENYDWECPAAREDDLDQICSYFSKLTITLAQSGHPFEVSLYIRCTVVGYIINHSIPWAKPQPLLGLKEFLNNPNIATPVRW